MDLIRILLVTDFALFRDGLRTILEHEQDMAVCDEAADADSAVRLAREKNPDLILLDLHLPAQSGVQAATQILTDNPEAKVIALMGQPDLDTLMKIMRAGVRGYLMKDAHVGALTHAIRVVVEGGAIVDPQVAVTMLSDYRRLAKYDSATPSDGFSCRDLEMLRYLAHGEGNREIARRMFLSEQTVKNELSDIYRRLGVENRTEAVATALRLGLISHDSGQV